MKKLLFSITLISSTFFAVSQNVGINSTGALPDNSAGLDVDYTNKGLLVPRVSLTSTTDVVTIPAPATSLLVYNTNVAMTGGAVGYWYYDGAAWVQALGPQGLAGTNGANGINGTNGIDGLNCWDTNGDGIQDAGEDVNLDGFWNNLDCAGATGLTGTAGANGINGLNCWDTNGDGIQDAAEDVNLDGFWDALDCAGATGIAGVQGIQGPIGPVGPMGPSWTLSTPSFNANGTMVVNGTAGSGGPVTSVAGAWLTSGNNPVAVGDFMGSINAADVKFRTNNIERMTIEANGFVGLGTTAPTQVLDVTGNVRFSGAIMPNNLAGTTGQALLSAGAGVAPTWGVDLSGLNQISRWIYPPTNINANTTYTLTAIIPGVTSTSSATVNLVGDWGVSPAANITIHHVEARTGEVRFIVRNSSGGTSYTGMDFVVTILR